MCRPDTLGGRRCPSHSNPLAITNRNARRRAQYATRHSGATKIQSEVSTPISADTVTPAKSPYETELLTQFHGRNSDQLFKSVSAKKNYSDLNVEHQDYEGHLVDLHYLNAKQLSGVINYTQLDENSYLEFGFGEIKPAGEMNYRSTVDDQFEAADLSYAEIADLSIEEQTAVRVFTSDSYAPINQALYGQEAVLVPDKGEYSTFFTEDNNSLDITDYDYRVDYTPEFIKEYTANLDSALAKGPGYQRTVYRGMSASNAVFKKDLGIEKYDPEAGTKWVDKNIKLGQEMMFDGYQSSSLDLNVALEYSAEKGGVVYEIITSSGLNATNISVWTNEMEVILPRNARYMVVGVHKNVGMDHLEGLNVIQLVEINEHGAITEAGNKSTPPPLTDAQLKVRAS